MEMEIRKRQVAKAKKSEKRLIATQVDVRVSEDITFMVFAGDHASKSDLLNRLVEKEHKKNYKKAIDKVVQKYVGIWGSRSTLTTFEDFITNVREALNEGMKDARHPENANVQIIIDGIKKAVDHG